MKSAVVAVVVVVDVIASAAADLALLHTLIAVRLVPKYFAVSLHNTSRSDSARLLQLMPKQLQLSECRCHCFCFCCCSFCFCLKNVSICVTFRERNANSLIGASEKTRCDDCFEKMNAKSLPLLLMAVYLFCLERRFLVANRNQSMTLATSISSSMKHFSALSTTR